MIEHCAAMENAQNADWHGEIFTVLWTRTGMLKSKYVFILGKYLCIFKYVCMLNHLELCLTLWDPMVCSPPGSSVHGILQARILEWVAIPSSRGSSWPRDQAVSLTSQALAGGFFTASATWEDPHLNIPMCMTNYASSDICKGHLFLHPSPYLNFLILVYDKCELLLK